MRPSSPHLALAVAGAVLALAASPGLAACAPPVAPDVASKPEKPILPTKGPCVDAKPGQTGCLGWEGYAFNDAIKAYNAKIPAFQAAATAYVAKLNDYVKASGDYARCEAQSLQ